MKKLILVMVFVLLTSLFIAFNYLLWDRESMVKEIENLEYANLAGNSNINALKREIAGLEEDNKNLDNKIDILEADNLKINQDKNAILLEKEQAAEEAREKVRIINVLKQYADINVLSEPIFNWVDALNKGAYEEAYSLEYAGLSEEDRKVSLEAYIQEMQVTKPKVDISEVKLDKLRGTNDGDIILQVRLDVKLSEDKGNESSRYEEGTNEIYVKIEHSREMSKFFISEINNN